MTIAVRMEVANFTSALEDTLVTEDMVDGNEGLECMNFISIVILLTMR